MVLEKSWQGRVVTELGCRLGMLGESTNWQRILPTTIEGLEKAISRPLSSGSSLGWRSKILTKKSPNLGVCTALTCLKNKYHGIFVNVKEIYQFIPHIFHLRELLHECAVRLSRHPKKESLKVATMHRILLYLVRLLIPTDFTFVTIALIRMGGIGPGGWRYFAPERSTAFNLVNACATSSKLQVLSG